MKIVGFSVKRPKQFNYKPLYYDERKERLEELRKKYDGQKEDNGVSPDFKEKLRSAWRIKEKRTGNITNRTLVIYFALVLLILYLFFFN